MKKLILAVVGLAAVSVVPQAGASAYPWGDVNCSGTVTSVDVDIVVAAVAGQPRPAGCSMPIDLNCSGHLSSVDISIAAFIANGGVYTPANTCI